MAYNPPYGPAGWRDLPDMSTEIDKRALDIIDQGILDAHALIGSGGARDSSTSILFVVFNEVTKTWPARSTVTSSPTQVVEWIGNAQLPTGAEGPVGGVDRWYGPINGSGVVPGDTVPPDEFPDPVSGVSLTAPTHGTITGASVPLTATLTTTSPTTFAYAQIATRGPAGQKIDTAFNPGVTVDGTLTMSGTATVTASGTWTAFATYNITGGATPADWVDGPAITFTVTLPTPPPSGTPGGIPLLSGRTGGSGLGWNSGTFVGGNDAADINAFATWRGRPLDAFLTFVGRDTWAHMANIHGSWPGYDGLLINSIPPQPNDIDCSATAAGTNDTFWRNYGSALTAAGLNHDRYMLRIWEVNGDWYSWAMGGGRNSVATFVAAIRRMSTSVKATAPNVKFSVNWNRGSYISTDWRTVMDQLLLSGPSGRYVDNIGIDSYDWYPGQINSTKWGEAQGQNPSPTSVATYARAAGIQMSIEEWALINATGGAAGNGGGDNPYYIQQMWDFINANADILSYEGYYNHTGAPAALQHVISNGMYPNAAAAYRSSTRWG